jgi:hypothetical protein
MFTVIAEVYEVIEGVKHQEVAGSLVFAGVPFHKRHASGQGRPARRVDAKDFIEQVGWRALAASQIDAEKESGGE